MSFSQKSSETKGNPISQRHSFAEMAKNMKGSAFLMNSGNPPSQSSLKSAIQYPIMSPTCLNNYVPHLNERILLANFARVLQAEHKKSNLTFREAAKKLDTTPATYAHYLHGRTSCSIKMLKEFERIYRCNLAEKAFEGNFLFSGRKKEIKLPREMTKELAYYVGYLQGDGYLGSDGKRVGFADEFKSQMEKIGKLTNMLFKKNGKVTEVISQLSKKPSYKFEIKSLVINSFLNVVFNIPKGTKVNLSIPWAILDNKNMLRYYLAGLYDADGTLPKHAGKAKQIFLDITLKDLKFIEEIKQSLEMFDIKTLPVYKRKAKSVHSDKPSITWELRIRQKGFILKFLQEIGFYHPEKAKRAKELETLLMGL